MIFRRFISVAAMLAALAPAAWSATAPAAPAKLAIPPAFERQDDVPLPDPDLWHRIRMGFTVEPLESPLVVENEAWNAGRPG